MPISLLLSQQFHEISVAPSITLIKGQEFIITEGSNGSITCTATGYPMPRVIWESMGVDGSRLFSGDPVISSTGVGNVTSVNVELMVIGAMRVDTGLYRCSADNVVSSTSTTIVIIVKGKNHCVKLITTFMQILSFVLY